MRWRRFLTGCIGVLAVMVGAPPAFADQVRDAQWHVDSLDLATAHTFSRGAGVTVAIIDSGVDASHPDLRGVLLPGTDLLDPGNEDAWTPEEHGTMVAGVLAGQGHGPGSGDGVLGVAPDARILPIRVTAGDDTRIRRASHLADGVAYAVAEGASVISISLSSEYTEADERAIAAARREDVVVVAAAGNRPDSDAVTFPAALDSVMAIGGVGRGGDRADVSVAGPELALAAPADEIVTTFPGGEYAEAVGTSFAAPIVAGAAALVRSRFPELAAGEVIHRLISTARDTGPDGHDRQYGHGVVDLVAALSTELEPAAPDDEPDDTRRDQWHHDTLDLPAAHEITRGEGVTVAVVGSDVDDTHPDLHHNVLPGVDLAGPEHQDAGTPDTSGTALAGIVAAHGNRLADHEPGSRGALGIAPAARILPIRITGGKRSDLERIELAASGIERAVADGAEVVLYTGGQASQDLFAEAVQAAQAAGVIVVAEAGYASETPSVWFPAANPAVVAVAGVDRDGAPIPDSVTGPEIALAAPTGLLTTAPDGRYTEDERGSAAEAVVAGAAALVRSQFPDMPAGDIVHRLVSTARDAGPEGRDDQYGHGMVDLVAALTADVPPLAPTVAAGEDGTPAGRAFPPPPAGASNPVGIFVLAGAVAAAVAVLVVRRARRRRVDPPAGYGLTKPE